MTQLHLIRIGTRASKLALAQTEEVKCRLLAAHPHLTEAQFEIIRITTTGDTIQDRPLNTIGGKGLFTKEIEEALLDGNIDLAVHSMKDVPSALPDGLIISCILEREDARDAFLSVKYPSLAAMPAGAKVGTSSLRRAAQIKLHRPDLKIVPLRGNVTTRIEKLKAGVCDATLLAVAGLKRLHMADVITEILPHNIALPAIAQGAVGIECRADDAKTLALLSPIHHAPTALQLTAERSLLATLEGSCRTPIAGFATLKGNRLLLDGFIAKPDGSSNHAASLETEANLASAKAVGITLAKALLKVAGPDYLQHG